MNLFRLLVNGQRGMKKGLVQCRSGANSTWVGCPDLVRIQRVVERAERSGLLSALESSCLTGLTMQLATEINCDLNTSNSNNKLRQVGLDAES